MAGRLMVAPAASAVTQSRWSILCARFVKHLVSACSHVKALSTFLCVPCIRTWVRAVCVVAGIGILLIRTRIRGICFW